MKQFYNKLIITLIFCISIFVLKSKINANTIKQVDINVYIDRNGNASVTEVWKAYLNTGTEGYRKFSNLGNKIISNFSVKDDTGIEYSNVSNWNSKSSFSSKAYKCGVNEDENEIELCWGISEYGHREYILKYYISNLVTQYKDYQGIYFNFFNIDQVVNNVKITIKSDYYFSDKTETVWNFGNKGEFSFDNGSIIINSNGKLYEKYYFSTLIKFGDNYFKTNNISNEKFDAIVRDAFKQEIDLAEILAYILSICCCAIFGFVLIYCIVYPFYPKLEKYFKLIKRKIYLNKIGETLPLNSKIDYYREIPCEGDILKAYFILAEYCIIPQEKLKKEIIGAMLLKWNIENNIEIIKIDENKYNINFNKVLKLNNDIENILFQIFVKISGKDKVLKVNEIENLSRNNYYKIRNWLNNIYKKEREILEEKGFVKGGKVTAKLREEAIKLKGFRKYLKNMSNISNREVLEVNIWGEYLVFAKLFGIANKVKKQFKRLYPNLYFDKIENVRMTTMDFDNITNSISRNLNRLDRKYYPNHYYSSSNSSGENYSSGGSSAGGSSGGGFR